MSSLRDHNIQTEAATTRKRTSIKKSLDVTGFFSSLDIVITGDDVEKYEPGPEGLFKAIHVLQADSLESVMVGDTTVDIEAGKRAGCTTVGVTYGFSMQEVIQAIEPNYLIDNIHELSRIITTLNR